MFNIGPMELIVILLVALIVVGPKKLPEVGKTIGRSLREFKKAQDDLKNSFDLSLDDDPQPRSTSVPPFARAAQDDSVADADAADDDADDAADADADDAADDAETVGDGASGEEVEPYPEVPSPAPAEGSAGPSDPNPPPAHAADAPAPRADAE